MKVYRGLQQKYNENYDRSKDADDYDPEYYPKNSEGRPMDGDTPLSREYVIINKNLVPIDNKDIVNSLIDLR